MAVESAVMFRKVVRIACLVLVVGLLLDGAATAQLPIPPTPPPPVSVGSVIPFNHGTTGVWGQIYQMAVTPNGHILFLDDPEATLYDLAPGATTPVALVGPAPVGGTANCSTLEPVANSDWQSSLVVDANNTLYLGDRYGSEVQFCVVPFQNGAWNFSAADNWTVGEPQSCAAAPPCTSTNTGTIYPQSMALGDDGTFYVSGSGGGPSNGIWKFTVNPKSSAYPNGQAVVTPLITSLDTDASNIAVDHAGNLFFIENAYGSASTKVNGIREIVGASSPSFKTVVASGAAGTAESGFPRIDSGFDGIKGLTFDAWGNLYFSSSNNQSYGGTVDGVFMIPNEGTPTSPNLVWADTVRVSPVGSGFPPLVDPRGYLWIPTGEGGNNWAAAGTNGAPCSTKDVAECTASGVVLWALGSANIGASPVGTAGTPQSVFYSFSKPTQGSFNLTGPGAANFAPAENPSPDPTVVPAVPNCNASQTYPAFSALEQSNAQYSWCQYFAQITPTTAGTVEAELQMVDASNKVIEGSDAFIYGIGQGANVANIASPAAVPLALGLNAPQQVAADPRGITYVADSDLKAVLEYPAGTTSQVVGTYLGTGLTAPTGVAVDRAGDLYIGDSGSLIEIPYIGSGLATTKQTTLMTGLGDHLNLAADSAGDVFVADKDKKQVVEMRNPQSTLVRENEPNLVLGASAGFTGPSAVATDNSGNVWVADGSNLWEITMPFGLAAEITSDLTAPVTGLAVDPSGSIFVAEGNGLWWIPYLTASGGLSVNGAVQVTSIPALSANPSSVALDGFDNAYVTYPANGGATAGLSQLGATGAVDWGQIVPFEAFEQDAQLYNLGNAPLTLSALSNDSFTGGNAADYAVIGATNGSPACSASTPTAPGQNCYFGIALTASTNGLSSASLAIESNAVNAPSIDVALTANVVPDPRNPTTATVTVTPSSGVTYPGAVEIQVTIASQDASNGTPTGNVVLNLSGVGKTQPTALANGQATFKYTNLLGGSYTASVSYGGSGTAGTAPDFAASGAKVHFTVNQAIPTLQAAAPIGTSGNITVYNGNTFLASGTTNTISASIASAQGTPTGTVTFCSSYSGGTCTPADPTQGSQGALSLSASGTVSFSTANLGLGVYNLTAVYSGDVNYVQQTVAVPAFEVINPSVEVTSTPASLTITPGTPVTTTLTLQPLVGFAQNVTLACLASSLPQYTECTFGYPGGGAPTGIIGVGNTLAGATAPTTITVTISSNVCTGTCGVGTAQIDRTTNSIARRAPWSLAGLFGLGMVGIIAGRKRLSRTLTMICLALMLSGVFMGISACTNAGYSTPPPAPKVATPQGSYAIQVYTYNEQSGEQNSIKIPLFTIPTTVN